MGIHPRDYIIVTPKRPFDGCLRPTAAMMAGIAYHIWSVGKLFNELKGGFDSHGKIAKGFICIARSAAGKCPVVLGRGP